MVKGIFQRYAGKIPRLYSIGKTGKVPLKCTLAVSCWSPLEGDIPNRYPLSKVYMGLMIKGTIPRLLAIFPVNIVGRKLWLLSRSLDSSSDNGELKVHPPESPSIHPRHISRNRSS